jgi:hypothetical protein
MKQPGNIYRNATRAEGLVLVVILVAIIAVGAWWLFSSKKQSQTAASAFGREMIERLTIQHDLNFFSTNLGPMAKQEFPLPQQQNLVSRLTELGVPAQPIKIDESITFEQQFFAPKGYFTAHLNYPGRPATIKLAISHPVGKWQVDDLEFGLGAGL